MLPVSAFENPAALAALAKLNPTVVGESSAAGAAAHARKDGGRTLKSSGAKVTGASRIGGDFKPEKDPAWLKDRDAVLDKIVARNAAKLEALPKPAIVVTLPDGKTFDGKAFELTPNDVATSISKGLAQACCVCSVKYSK